ncbi:uncharacterized protein LOC115445784 [Manduca sexta]|uniref:uncharacterized protein LOC115445784 n=1 Tax=Manduca sexta TaxID=7130 RepID=UPI00188DF7E6|nr:uncharacterized protein LOC115445784 [Manduca sexta]
MILTWHQVKIFFVVISVCVMIASEEITHPHHWKMIEHLAETHSYIVAILNEAKNYTCTGSIINKQTILTSGSCLNPEPAYVAVGVAIFGSKVDDHNIFRIAYTVLHGDYTFELKALDPNVTKMHSNIGLAFVKRPILDIFIALPDLGNYYASELKNRKLIVVGYGLMKNSNLVSLQHQAYHQTPCANPKWYYCVCGIEYSAYTKTYYKEFGKGAPVMIQAGIIGITATPCGLLSLKSMGIKYNIFTVLGPYLPWIQKTQTNTTFSFRAYDNGAPITDSSLKYFYIVLATCNFFY